MMKLLKGILLPALLALASVGAAKKDGPTVKVTNFDQELINLSYFEDSEVALISEYETGKLYRSENAGKKWEELDFLALAVIRNPYDHRVAVALGDRNVHRITYDRGESWRKFETKEAVSWAGMPVVFHATDNKKILFNTAEDILSGIGDTFYTEDGFKTEPKLLRRDRLMCSWAKGTDRFLYDSDLRDKYDSRVLCIVTGKFSDRTKDNRLLISDK